MSTRGRWGRSPRPSYLRTELLGGAASATTIVAVERGVLQLFEQLLAEFTAERRTEVEAFLAEVSEDQALLMQLTPEAMDLFNAGVTDRPGVRYGAVVTRAPTPSVSARLELGLDPYAQATHGIYELIHRQTLTMPRRNVEIPLGQTRATMKRALGVVPTEVDSDGIVPTLSQPWGELIAAVDVDHLEVIGHFADPDHAPPHVDWLCSCSSFDHHQFEQRWSRVVQFMLLAP